MHVGGVHNGSMSAVAAGVRAQQQSATLAFALREVAPADSALVDAVALVSAQGAEIAAAGLAAANEQLVGQLIDMLA